MKLTDFRNLDTSNPGSWPTGVKFAAAAVLVLLICAAGWYFKVSDQKEQLARSERTEQELRREFTQKHGRVVNLEAYREQLAEMDEMFRQMVRQLPSRTEMPQLLIDISQSAQTAGIDTQLFQPGPEKPEDFYAEQPISVRMVGNYHQFGEFISVIAQLPRVVILTMHDIELRPDDSGRSRAGRGATVAAPSDGNLRMSGTVRTYRYLDDDEQAQLQAEQDAAATSGRRR
ncbi:MAG: type 4a pilus biogenesis protein PilO [Xanthomonadales bacterium]|nr:type 4a pilus biogenesis protein PilO [Xanthomonadales bacterium]